MPYSPTLTVGQLREALKDVADDTWVETEGCDCVDKAGSVSGVITDYEGNTVITIFRREFEFSDEDLE